MLLHCCNDCSAFRALFDSKNPPFLFSEVHPYSSRQKPSGTLYPFTHHNGIAEYRDMIWPTEYAHYFYIVDFFRSMCPFALI